MVWNVSPMNYIIHIIHNIYNHRGAVITALSKYNTSVSILKEEIKMSDCTC